MTIHLKTSRSDSAPGSTAPTSMRAPGPRGAPLIGNARKFQRELIQTLLDGRRDYGDVVRFDGIGPLFPVYLVAHPDGVKHVLQDNHRNYPKTPFVNNRWRALVGEGLICSEGDFWRRQRRLCQPAFHRHLISSFGGIMTQITAEVCDEWEQDAEAGREVNVTRKMTRLALNVLGQALFDADWRDDAEVMARAVELTIGEAYRRFGQFVGIPDSIPTPSNRRFAAGKTELDQVIYRVIHQRMNAPQPHPADLLEALLTATADDGATMDVEQVRNEVMTFMFGGHETVAAGLTWSLDLLSRHVEVTGKLEIELDVVLGDRPPTVADLPNLPYLARVVRECLRLYPPVWLISRTSVEDDVIDGKLIPAGSMVLLSPFVTQRHQEFWGNPDGFDPDRWSPEQTAGLHRFAWWPFSGGPRKCIGDLFGQQEMQLVIAMIIQRYRLATVAGTRAVPKPGITLGQVDDIVMTVAKRVRSGAPQTVTESLLRPTTGADAPRCPFPHQDTEDAGRSA